MLIVFFSFGRVCLCRECLSVFGVFVCVGRVCLFWECLSVSGMFDFVLMVRKRIACFWSWMFETIFSQMLFRACHRCIKF